MDSGNLSVLRRVTRTLTVVFLAFVTAMLVIAVMAESFGQIRGRILLTFAGLAAAALFIDPHLRSWSKFRKSTIAGLVAIGIAQVCYLLLVWTGWTAQSSLWRTYWIALVGSIIFTHIVLLRHYAVDRRDWIERGTPLCVLAFGLMVMGLALHRHIPSEPHPLYKALGAIPGLGALIGSFIAWRRYAASKPAREPLTRTAKTVWICLSYALVLTIGWYVGRAGAPRPGTFELLPSALAGMSAKELDAQLATDLEELDRIIPQMELMAERSIELERRLHARLTAEDRSYYLPEEDDEVRALFWSYLSQRMRLLRLTARYAGFEVVPDPSLRARCFLVGFTAATTTFQTSLELVTTYRDRPVARRKLNESERRWGIPAGMFDRIAESVTNERNLDFLAETAAYFEHKRGEWRKTGILPEEDFDRLERHCLRSLAYINTHQVSRHEMLLERFFDRVKQDAYTPIYTVQSMVAEWIGDTRVVQRPSMVSEETIESIAARLRPGDILLERRNWYLSNAFLPGFWPHAAIYTGHTEDLQRLGIADDPRVQAHLEEYAGPAPDGHDHTVIESVSEGVIMNSLAESMHADYVAVLRPRLPDEQIGEAIARAFRHVGKPYDFEFDFFTADKLVCTELVYRAYEGMLHFDLVRVMGRDTLPAVEIVRKFERERGSDTREMDFVLFLDAEPVSGAAQLAGVEEFCASADRPRAFNE